MTSAQLKESWHIASRRPGTLESWAYANVPKLISLLENTESLAAHGKTGMKALLRRSGFEAKNINKGRSKRSS